MINMKTNIDNITDSKCSYMNGLNNSGNGFKKTSQQKNQLSKSSKRRTRNTLDYYASNGALPDPFVLGEGFSKVLPSCMTCSLPVTTCNTCREKNLYLNDLNQIQRTGLGFFGYQGFPTMGGIQLIASILMTTIFMVSEATSLTKDMPNQLQTALHFSLPIDRRGNYKNW